MSGATGSAVNGAQDALHLAGQMGGVDRGAWVERGGTWSLAIAAVPGLALLNVVVEGDDATTIAQPNAGPGAGPEAAGPSLTCGGLEDIATATLGRTVLLCGRLPRQASAGVRLHAAAAPRSTLWRWTAEATPARRMRPLCRALDAPPHRQARRPDPAQAREALRRGDLDGALDQFARACLAGYDSIACDIARAIMEFAAIHPFARAPKLGALPAALLGKVDA